jgi:hypothetical protein
MSCLVLSRVMILALFLIGNVLDKGPRLFSVSSEVKSSRDVHLAIYRACLFAEGDVVKHLSRIGLNIVDHQDPVDEINFKVFYLATDLRDGVLFARLSAIVTELLIMVSVSHAFVHLSPSSVSFKSITRPTTTSYIAFVSMGDQLSSVLFCGNQTWTRLSRQS